MKHWTDTDFFSFFTDFSIPRILMAFCAVFLMQRNASGVEPHFNAEQLTAASGLPCNSIRCIYQDSNGFIWGGTVNSGIFRYDGHDVKTIYPDYEQSVTLPDPRIKSITEDGNCHLWISTMSDQVCCYSLISEKFVDYTGRGAHNDNYSQLVFFGDEIWLYGPAQGCLRVIFDGEDFSSEKLSVDTNDLPSDNISFVFSGKDSTVWIGTDAGLVKYADGETEWEQEDHAFRFAAVIEDTLCFLSTDGTLWTERNGEVEQSASIPGIGSATLWSGEFVRNDREWILFNTTAGYSWNPHSAEVEKLPVGPGIKAGRTVKDADGNVLVFNNAGDAMFYDNISGRMSGIDITPEHSRQFGTRRYDFVRMDDGTVWISTHGDGIWTYNPDTGSVRNYVHPDRYTNIIMCLYRDRSDNLWLGMEYSGLIRLSLSNTGADFIHFGDAGESGYSDMVRMVHVAPGGHVLLCTRDGMVHKYDSELSSAHGMSRFPNAVYAVAKDTADRVWTGTRGGGLYIGGRNLRHSRNDPSSLSSNNIFSIIRDDSGRMWIGTFGGGLDLAETDASGNIFFRTFFNDSYGRRRTRAMALDNLGMIWLGTSDGLIVFDPDSLSAGKISYKVMNSANKILRSNEIRAVHADSDGRIWIAETGQGFCICERADTSFSFKYYSMSGGLVSSQVQGFVEDKAGNMWISTENGVSCFDPDTERFRNFILSNDIHSNTCLDNCAALLDDGRLIFGTNAGLAIVDPAEILAKPVSMPQVVFTGLKVDGAEMSPAQENAPMQVSLPYSPEISLSYDRNSFSVSFSILDFSSEGRFSYILEGYDREWSTPSELNFASYRDVSPGKYRLLVRSSDAAGQWSDEPAVLNINVRPPFYRSTAAWIMYALVFIFLLWLTFRILKKMNALRNAAEVEKQVTEYKLVFFTNVSHEFRTPLTLILNSLDKLKALSGLRPETEKAVRTMETGAHRMLRLVNQLIEFRKLQTGKFRLKIEKTEAVGFLREIFDTFEGSAASKNIDYSFTCNKDSAELYMDRGDVDKIVYNLISNALKYTPAGGSVNFDVRIDDVLQKIELKVTDNGVGIAPEKRSQLFSRFMQNAGSESSMGIGLNLTKSLVEADKGRISFEDNPGGGSIFTVVLPTDISLFSPEDIVDSPLTVTSDVCETALDRGSELPTGKVSVHDKAGTAPLNSHRILVIEDDNDIREMIADELTPYFQVSEAPEGETGLKILEEDKDIELVVCDVLMPGISGFEVVKRIKSNFDTCHIPVILLTALSAEEKQMKGYESGADAYISKPFSPDYVLMRIRTLLEQRDRLREKFSNDLSLKADTICTNERDREFMSKVSEVLEKQLSNPYFSMDDFASEMAMGRSSFYSKIHSLTGYSPNKYIRVLRLKKAAELLMTGEYTSAEVAFMVGIQDPSYFSKSFKEQFGLSPKTYQKQAADSKK